MGPQPVDKPGDSISRTYLAVGDAWSWLVLREAILFDVRRFDDFCARLGIARSTLAARLAQLTGSRLLERGSATGRSGAEYLVTPRGADFFGCLMAALRFGNRWYFDGDIDMLPSANSGQRVLPVIRCEHCKAEVVATDVTAPRDQLLALPVVLVGRQRAPGFDLLERKGPSQIAATLGVMGDWWSGLVIRDSFFGTHRFDEYRRHLGISTNILSNRLARLVEFEILERRSYQVRPDRCEYHLTARGLDLYPVALAMNTWGDRWLSNGSPPVTLTHRLCGHSLAAYVGSANDTARLERDALRFAVG